MTPPHRISAVALRAALAVALTIPLVCAAPLAAQKKEEPPQTAPPQWPALTPADKARGEKWLKLLTSKKEDIRAKAASELEQVGLGMGKRMFQRMTDGPHHNANEALAAILTKLLQPEHAALLGTEAHHKSVFARTFVLKRLAAFGRAESVPVFRAARKDKDVEVAWYAALGLVKTTDDTAALDAVLERCTREWAEIGDEVSRYLTPARNERFMPWISKKLGSSEITEQIATLRLMRSIAPEKAKGLVKHFLDSSESILKKEAINTLRVIVDGAEPMPLKKITVFLVIKMAKEWKARI